jgi:predicted MFS family arabinose efflux permease
MMTDDRAFATADAGQAVARMLNVPARTVLVGLTAFLTLVDLFAAQAILPVLAHAYAVGPAAMGFAVNASTLGMAAGSLAMAVVSERIDRRLGILFALGVLAIPTSLLAVAPDLTTFTVLRIVQGLCMSAAFTLTLAYVGESFDARSAGGAFAAYITGNVASNLIGRLASAAVVDEFGLSANFLFFAALNLAGAALVYATIESARMREAARARRSPFAVWLAHWRNPALAACFGIGFCILFAFIGTFSYVNFVLVRPPLNLGMMSIGFVYCVFLPSIVTTPLAGRAVRWLGTRASLWSGLGLALAGLPLLVLTSLPAVLVGMVLVGVGTFFAQATATGFVGRAAMTDRVGASGMYLASYFTGGLLGSLVLGEVFVRGGWDACVAGVGAALVVAALLTTSLTPPLDKLAARAAAGR